MLISDFVVLDRLEMGEKGYWDCNGGTGFNGCIGRRESTHQGRGSMRNIAMGIMEFVADRMLMNR